MVKWEDSSFAVEANGSEESSLRSGMLLRCAPLAEPLRPCRLCSNEKAPAVRGFFVSEDKQESSVLGASTQKRERGAPSPTWEVGCCLGPFGGPPVPATDRPSVCVRVYRRWRLSPSRHIVVTTPNAPLAFFLGCHFFLMPSGCASRVDHRPLDSGSSRSSSWAAG